MNKKDKKAAEAAKKTTGTQVICELTYRMFKRDTHGNATDFRHIKAESREAAFDKYHEMEQTPKLPDQRGATQPKPEQDTPI